MAAFEETQKFCLTCNRLCLAHRAGTSHVFHLLMCLFTCGLWVIVWALSAVKIGGWRCVTCGGARFR